MSRSEDKSNNMKEQLEKTSAMLACLLQDIYEGDTRRSSSRITKEIGDICQVIRDNE